LSIRLLNAKHWNKQMRSKVPIGILLLLAPLPSPSPRPQKQKNTYGDLRPPITYGFRPLKKQKQGLMTLWRGKVPIGIGLLNCFCRALGGEETGGGLGLGRGRGPLPGRLLPASFNPCPFFHVILAHGFAECSCSWIPRCFR